MPATSGKRLISTLKIALCAVPWLAAMYLFYWLDSSGTWTVETAHRGKMSVIILGTGMLLSFVAWSVVSKNQKV